MKSKLITSLLFILLVSMGLSRCACTKECQAALAELSIDIFGVSAAQVFVGEPVTLLSTIKNVIQKGSKVAAECLAPAGKSQTNLEIGYSANEAGPFQVTSRQPRYEPGLDVNETRNLWPSLTFNKEGWYIVREVADDSTQVEEHEENNNISEITGWAEPRAGEPSGAETLRSQGYVLIHVVSRSPEDALRFAGLPQVQVSGW